MLADAWQPLYVTLDANQKQRLRLAATYVLHEVREVVESRRMQDGRRRGLSRGALFGGRGPQIGG
jgi:hypothetical protein